MSRMDKYDTSEKVSKRINKNQNLYKDIKDYSNIKEEVIIEPIIKKELNRNIPKKRKIRPENNDINDSLPVMYKESKKKIYDINEVLDKAKNSRVDRDELEDKRNLEIDEYNIARNLDSKMIEEYNLKKQEMEKSGEEGELQELINTIYGNKTLEIEKQQTEEDLMSDLIGNDDETLIDENMVGEIIEQEKTSFTNEIKNLDKSFFTKSLELSRKDFEEADQSFVETKEENRSQLIIKIVSIVLSIILLVVLYILFFAI